MSWVYLDDRFMEHPKVLAAGGDAVLLFVAALCYTNRNLTGGAVPAAMVDRLTDRTNAQALAKRLVDVRLWEATGEGYQIHDYAIWNAKALQRSDQARNAANRRWSSRDQDPERSATLDAGAMREQCGSNAHAPGLGLGASVVGGGVGEGGDRFAEFWLLYPRKIGMPRAERAYRRAKDSAAVMAGLQAWTVAWEAAGTDEEHIPHPSTWLSECRWKDKPSAPRPDGARAVPPEHALARNTPQDRDIWDEKIVDGRLVVTKKGR